MAIDGKLLHPLASGLLTALVCAGCTDGAGGTSDTEATTGTSGGGTSTTEAATTDVDETTGATTDTTGGELEAPDFFGERVLNIAHRGGAGEFPEHTLFAYESALELGVDVLEVDIHWTQDDVFVAMHDDTVDRTTDGSGLIATLTLEEIKALDAGYWFTLDGGVSYPHRGQGLTAPTLEEVFTAFPGTLFSIEVKSGQPVQVAPLLELLDAHELRGNVILVSGVDSFVDAVREAAPDVLTGMSVAEMAEFVLLTPESEATYEPPTLIMQAPVELPGITVLTPERIAQAEQLGMRVQAWTINDPDEMTMLVDWGVHAIMTDYPSALADVLDP